MISPERAADILLDGAADKPEHDVWTLIAASPRRDPADSAANERAALVANRGEALLGKVARVASPTRKTLKSFARFW